MGETVSHIRRPQWPVYERCLALLQRLMRGSATSEELLQIIYDKAAVENEDLTRSEAERRFEEDRRRLRNSFKCVIEHERRENAYNLIDIESPLIDLPIDAVRGLAFLKATFNNDNVLMVNEINSLIKTLRMVIPGKRWRDIEREYGMITVDLTQRDQDQISDEVWAAVQTTVAEHRQLEFDYYANEDGKPRIHLVEPESCYFDPIGGHYYLKAYCIETRGPKGQYLQEKWYPPYRLGRMANPRVLPKKFKPGSRTVRKYELVYRLSPKIVRGGVTKHFADSIIDEQPDGSALVRVFSADLFLDLRKLLRYGPNCRVIGGEEALGEMKKLVEQMYQQYFEE